MINVQVYYCCCCLLSAFYMPGALGGIFPFCFISPRENHMSGVIPSVYTQRSFEILLHWTEVS